MLTVFREMAHSLARQLAHLEADKQRLGRDVSEEQQDAILAEVLERAIEDGERAVARTPEQLEVLRESGVVDAGGHGLVLILAGVVAGLRGDDAELPEVSHHEAPRLSLPHHEDSRYRYCTNFIVAGSGLSVARLPAAAGGARRLGPRRRRRGDAQGPRPHRRARRRRWRCSRAPARSPTSTSPTCASRWPSAAPACGGAGRTGVVAVAAGEGLERLFAELGADVVPGGETLNPSTYELLAGIHGVAAEEVLVLPSSSNVVMAAERACELSEKPARVVAGDLPAGEPAGPGRARSRRRGRRERRAARGGARRRRHRRRRPGRPRRRPGPLQAGRRGRLRRRRDRRLGRRRLDPDDDDPAPRRGGRDRHRDRRRGGADPARGDRHPRPRRGRDRDPRGGPAELVVAARRPVARALLRRRSRAEPRRAARRPRPLAAPQRPRRLARGPRRRRPEARRGRGRSRASAPSATSSTASRTATATASPPLGRRSEPGETGDRPGRGPRHPSRAPSVAGGLTIVGGQSRRREPATSAPPGSTSPGSPTSSIPARALLLTGKLSQTRLRGERVRSCVAAGGGEGEGPRTDEPARPQDPPPRQDPRPGAFVPVHPATEDLRAAADPRLGRAGRAAGRRTRSRGCPAELRARRGLAGVGDAIRAAHFPESPEEAEAALARGSPSKSCSSTRRCSRPASARTAPRGRRRASAGPASRSGAGSTRCRSSRPATSSPPSTRSTPTSTPASRCSGC